MTIGYYVIWPFAGPWPSVRLSESWPEFAIAWERVSRDRGIRRTQQPQQHHPLLPYQPESELAVHRARHSTARLSAIQIRDVAEGLGQTIMKRRYRVWACSILPQYIHPVLGTSPDGIAEMCRQLKSAATRRLGSERRRPQYIAETERSHAEFWAPGEWRCPLRLPAEVRLAILYAEQTPKQEGRSEQFWPFVTAFESA